ncbi:hypothetical protein [Devosia sp. 2618]|uniref:diacylglycerol/polyprenol kinase family protein n=1 Tax=Devosia sp. 2618 TaxID=3156454 RepID=UPI00339B6A46
MSFTLADGFKVALILAAIPLVMLAVGRLGKRFGWDAEVNRKLVHVATGCLALTFPLLFSNPLPVLILLAIAILFMFVIRSGLLGGLGSALHGVERQSYGEIYLALAIAVTFIRAEEHPMLYVLPILVITLSDTAAALVGTVYGRRRFPVEGGAKSIEGVVVFFIVTWLASLIVLVLMTSAAPLNLVLISMLIAAFCALVEVDSWRGLDNLFVPVGAFLLLSSHLDSSPLDLVFSTGVFLAFLVVLLLLAPTLKLSEQAARANAILLFLIISIVSLHNVILPTLTIVAYLAARTLRPCDSKRPDYDLLFVAAMVSLLWLFVGDAGGRSVISLFNLTFAGALVGFLAVAMHKYWRVLILPAMAAAGWVAWWAAQANMPYSRWFMPSVLEIAAALIVVVVLPLLRPEWFASRRSLRIFGLAMIVPSILFLRGVVLQ